jgi:hypothetical protein
MKRLNVRSTPLIACSSRGRMAVYATVLALTLFTGCPVTTTATRPPARTFFCLSAS